MKSKSGVGLFITLILLFVIAVSIFDAQAHASGNGSPWWVIDNRYAKVAVVDEIDAENDIIRLAVPYGSGVFIYTFAGVEDLCRGDIVGMLMDDNGTPYITDDIILSVTYSGWDFAAIGKE